jgi:hypothetical protein
VVRERRAAFRSSLRARGSNGAGFSRPCSPYLGAGRKLLFSNSQIWLALTCASRATSCSVRPLSSRKWRNSLPKAEQLLLSTRFMRNNTSGVGGVEVGRLGNAPQAPRAIPQAPESTPTDRPRPRPPAVALGGCRPSLIGAALHSHGPLSALPMR